jgi:hypothetical protein
LGDFNLVRFASEKSNGVINHKWADAFNDWVSRWGLIELNLANKAYTWTNNQENLIMARIDRVFVTTDWEAAFPLARVKALERPPSDHNPLLVNLGDNVCFGKKKFRFEKWWLEKDNFRDIVVKAWSEPCKATNIMDRWQFRVITFRRLVRGWASNEVASLNKKKRELADEYNILDNKAEEGGLSSSKLKRLKEVTDELGKIWALDEIKIRQRSRYRNILEGDRNTAYFQAIANRRSRKKSVSGLMGPDGWVEDQPGMLKVAVDFYKQLFAEEEGEDLALGNNFWLDGEKVTQGENDLLTAPFNEGDIKEAIFGSYAEGAPGPDGLPFLFYQKFWDIVKEDIVKMFEEFHKGDLDLYRLNFAMLTLIPKVEEAKEMNNFRPISLINCSFKIFSKVLTSRLEKVTQRLISENQSAFIHGRYILESVVIAHELVHHGHKNGDPGVIIKLDYEKAYDRVCWNFLFEVLESRGFDRKWIEWMKYLVKGGSVGVNLNGEESSYFKPGKGLRQGDPISPLLFNIVGDVLTRMLMKAERGGLIEGLMPEFREGGVISLQYADDTILFSTPDEQLLRNLKSTLVWFEKLSGMRINYHKSEIIPLHLSEEQIHVANLIFGCPIGSFPIKYLGIPLHFDKLRREDLQPVVDKIMKKIASWRGSCSLMQLG